MRILALAPFIPYPLDNGSAMRTYHILERLARRHPVDLLCFAYGRGSHVFSGADAEMRLKGLRGIVSSVRVVVGDEVGGVSKDLLSRLSRLVFNIPVPAARVMTPEMVAAFSSLLSSRSWDILHLELPWTAGYAKTVDTEKTKVVLNLHNIESLLIRDHLVASPPSTWLDRIRWQRQCWVTKRWELSAVRRVDLTLVPSWFDHDILKAQCPSARLRVVPNAVDTRAYPLLPDPGNANLIFTGSLSYRPNAEGVLWFIRNVLPAVRLRYPTAKFFVVGRDPPDEVLDAHDGDSIIVTGAVAEIQPYVQQATLCVVPLFGGSGTRLKILEAMAWGRPVVSTSVGCQGLDVVDGTDIIVADSAQAFADAVCRLLASPALRASVAKRARALVEGKYDWDAVMASVLDEYEMLAGR